MELLSSRAFALFCCIIMIFGSIVAGTGASLGTLRTQAESEFLLSGLQYDLDDLAAQCYNISVIGGRYLPQDDDAITGLLSSRDKLTKAATPGEKYRAQSEMTDQARILYQKLGNLSLSAQDRSLLEKCIVNIDSILHIISGNQYNTVAADYNKTIGAFPANLLGGFVGAKPLELFE